MLTAPLIRNQIADLLRIQRGLARDFTVAYLGSDDLTMQAIRAEYLLLGDLIRQLRAELRKFEDLVTAQRMAVIAVEEMLGL